MQLNRPFAALFAAMSCVAGTSEAAAHADEHPTRSVWLALTYQVLLSDTFEPSSRHGAGASVNYDFHISPRFDLGLALAYRLYPGARETQQLGYGAILRHFFSADWSQGGGVFPYLDYGLLLQQTFINGRTGSAVSHDTRLGGGLLLRRWGVPVFVGVAGHYSRLQSFDVAAKWIPYADVQLGWVHAF